jgi:flagellum-specific peptidoglycan hydrolase FlgJ
MDAEQKLFVQNATVAAKRANHVFPEMAACEAALESNYGKSSLAAAYNNLFGCKQHSHPIYGTHVLPTREFENGQWVVTDAKWIVYPSWDACFSDRMATLQRLSNALAHYKAALEAQDAETYVRQVSQSWSTDPAWVSSDGKEFLSKPAALAHDPQSIEVKGLGRALKVLAIYDAIAEDWNVTA